MKITPILVALATALSGLSALAQPPGLSFTNVNLSSGNGPAFVLAVDINNDGFPGLVAANFGFRFGGSFGGGQGSGSTLSVFTNDGFGNLSSNATLTVGSEPACVAAADLNGDGWVDLISANVGDNTLTVLTNNRHGGFVLSGTYSVGTAPAFVTTADVNGDGKVDLISADFGGSTMTVLTNDGHGGFKLSSTIKAGSNPNCIAAVDINGDGKVDLVCANSGDSTLQTFINNGRGGFTSTATINVPGGAGWVVGTDVDDNGSIDLVAAGPTLTVLTNNGHGVFGLKSTAYSSGSGMVAAADMNGDGHVDLVCPNNGNGVQGSATVLTNDGHGNFTNATTIPIGIGGGFVNYPNTVTVADFNGDGNMDFAVDCYASLNYDTTSPSTLTVLTQINVPPRPILTITSPANDSVLTTSGSLQIKTQTVSSYPPEVMLFYIGQELIGVSTNAPFDITARAGSILPGTQALQAAVIDASGEIGFSPEVQINVTSPNVTSTNAQPSPNGLLLWLDSSYASSVKTNAGGSVTAWMNKAPGATNAVTYTGNNDNDTFAAYNSSAPTYAAVSSGLNVVNFTGNGYLDNLNFSSVTPANLTIFLLAAPLANPGDYSGFMAFNESQATNDYQTGINVDQGTTASADFNRLNVEGAKTGANSGFQFLDTPSPFGSFHLIEIDYGGGVASNNSAVTVLVDNVPQASFIGSPTPVALNNCYIGTRAYASGGDPTDNHDLTGQIAAVLVYDQQLDGADLTQTRAYLNGLLGAPGPTPVVTITAPTNGASVLTSAGFVITATSSSPVNGMDFYLDGQLLGEATVAPYSFQVQAGSIPPGSHSLQAVAVRGLAAGTPSPVVNIVVNAPGTALINFDALDATAGAVTGTPLVDYLGQYGVTMSKVTVGTALEAENASSLTGAIQVNVPSAPNFFTQAGLNQPVSFTLNFASPLQSFGFTRVGLAASSGQVSHPQWTATIFDATGTALGSVSEALMVSSDPVAAKSFVLTGANIASVHFDSDSQGIAAFPAVLLDNLLLNSNPTTPNLSVVLSVVSPPVNNIIAPATIVLGANVTDTISATGVSYSVSFFAGPTLLGTANGSPFQITWNNVLPGSYSVQARVRDASGLTAYSAPATVNVQPEANSTEVTFDTLNTSKAPVTGAALTTYLAGFGVSVFGLSPGTALTVDSQQHIAGGAAVLAASPPNLLTQTGSSGPVQFTLGFTPFLSQFGFTRPELLANPFVSHPAWQVTAFDGAGNVVGQVGEAEIDSSTNVGAAEFSLGQPGGAGIARVEFASEGSGFTTFNGMLIDNLILTKSTSTFPPAVAITAPVSGVTLAKPPVVTITAAAVDALGIASVSFYANGVLIGTDTTSPYSMQWQNPVSGNYVLTAVASDNFGLTQTSAPVNVVIKPSAFVFGIATPPASQTVAAGGSVTFNVVVTGTQPVTYQWSHGKTTISGAISSTLILSPPINDGAAGDYSVAVSVPGKTIVSTPAVLTVIDPPTITTQPAGQTISPGSAINLNVVAAGGGPFTYQWLLNGTAIPGATGSTYIVPLAQPLNSGNYQVVVANLAASALSAVAGVIVQTAITIPETNNTFATRAGINPLLGAVAADNQTATVQAGAPLPDGLPGGNSIWFTWTPAFSGTVSLTTQGSAFDTVMAVYTGTALNNLKVVAADDDSGGFLTSLVSFNVMKGTQYQIAVDGFQGAAGRVVLGFPAGSGGRILNPASGGSVPVIVKGPASQTVAPGAKATLSVQATSASKLNYQWYFQNAPIAGATGSSFSINAVRPGLVGPYYVLVANAVGSAQSEPASLQIEVNSSGKAGSAENKFINAPGAPSPASLAENITPLAAGGDTRGFSVSQVFSTVGAASEPGEPEPCGQVPTASQWFVYTAPGAGMLQVNTDGSTFNTIIGVYTGPGTSFSSLVEAGCGYSTNYLVQGQPSVLIPEVAKGTTFYILVAGYQGASGVAQVQIGLGQPLSFSGLPASQLVTAGSNATFAVATTGSTPSSYQWQLNGANLPGGTKQTYTVTNAQAGAAGNYTVIVSNVMGAATSSPPAELTVQYAPAIVSGPSNVTVTAGQPAKLSVTAIGVNVKTNRFVCQWYFDFNPIAKATNLTLSFPSANLTNGGTYFIVISNSYGFVSGGPATLTVLPKGSPAAAGVAMPGISSPLTAGEESANLAPGGSLDSVAGTYSGLFYPASGATEASSGFFTATVASQGDGAFSANLLLDGGSYPFTGQFNSSGSAFAIVPRPGQSPVTASLRLALAPADGQMTGVISNADWISTLKAGRAATNPAPDVAGQFALALAPGTSIPVGWLTLTNKPDGTALVTGTLPDGAAIFRAAPIGQNDTIPVYVPLYSGQGLFLGWITLTNSPGQDDFGNAFWLRPGLTNASGLSIVK